MPSIFSSPKVPSPPPPPPVTPMPDPLATANAKRKQMAAGATSGRADTFLSDNSTDKLGG